MLESHTSLLWKNQKRSAGQLGHSSLSSSFSSLIPTLHQSQTPASYHRPLLHSPPLVGPSSLLAGSSLWRQMLLVASSYDKVRNDEVEGEGRV